MSIRVLAAFSLHEQRFGARETPDRQTDNGDKKHTGDDGARIEAHAAPRRGASVGGGAVECGWRRGRVRMAVRWTAELRSSFCSGYDGKLKDRKEGTLCPKIAARHSRQGLALFPLLI
jgi:hypothetical protein